MKVSSQFASPLSTTQDCSPREWCCTWLGGSFQLQKLDLESSSQIGPQASLLVILDQPSSLSYRGWQTHCNSLGSSVSMAP